MSDEAARQAAERVERQAFTEHLLRWQRESPGYGAAAQPEPAAVTTTSTPAAALSALIQAGAQAGDSWPSDRLSTTARDARSSWRPLDRDAFFYTSAGIMNLISHAIEERIIAERRNCEVYAGFQRLALVRPQLRRYRALVDVARYVYLFGIDDTGGDPDIMTLGPRSTFRFIIKPELGTGLERFWFVVVDDPRMPTALLARHLAGDLWAPRQAERDFAGIWTFNPSLVAQIIAVLRQAARNLYYNVPVA